MTSTDQRYKGDCALTSPSSSFTSLTSHNMHLDAGLVSDLAARCLTISTKATISINRERSNVFMLAICLSKFCYSLFDSLPKVNNDFQSLI